MYWCWMSMQFRGAIMVVREQLRALVRLWDTVPLSPFSWSVLSPPCRYHCQSLSNWIFSQWQRDTLLFLCLSLLRRPVSLPAVPALLQSLLCLIVHCLCKGSCCSFSVPTLLSPRLQSASKCHPMSIALPGTSVHPFSNLSQSVNPVYTLQVDFMSTHPRT